MLGTVWAWRTAGCLSLELKFRSAWFASCSMKRVAGCESALCEPGYTQRRYGTELFVSRNARNRTVLMPASFLLKSYAYALVTRCCRGALKEMVQLCEGFVIGKWPRNCGRILAGNPCTWASMRLERCYKQYKNLKLIPDCSSVIPRM